MTCHPHLMNPGSMVWANSRLLKPPANIHNLSELTFAILTIGADSETWATTRFVGDCPNMVRKLAWLISQSVLIPRFCLVVSS
jgi:hypothetical protein